MAIERFINTTVTVVYEGNMSRMVCTLLSYDDMGIMVAYNENKVFLPWRYIEQIREVTEDDRIEEIKKEKLSEKNRVSPLFIFSITMLFIGILVTYLSYFFIRQIPQFGLEKGISGAIAAPLIIIGILGSFLALFSGRHRLATLLSACSVIAIIVIIVLFGA